MTWTLLAALPFLGAAAHADLRWRIVPDGAVVGLSLVGLLTADHTGSHALTGLAALGLGVFASSKGLWGWGDAKLLGAAGLTAGPAGTPALILYTCALGGLLAAMLLVARPFVRARLARPPARWPRWLRAELTRLRRAPSVPYALAISCGVVGALLVPLT